MKLYAVIAAGLAMTLAMPANADQPKRQFADIYTECGLGAVIAPNNAVVAAVTNVTWDLGTTAISSNATTPEACHGSRASTAAFIYEAYPSIEQDLSRGEGEHLSALLRIAGCETSMHPDLALSLRSDLAELAGDNQYGERTTFERAGSLFEALELRATAVGCSMI